MLHCALNISTWWWHHWKKNQVHDFQFPALKLDNKHSSMFLRLVNNHRTYNSYTASITAIHNVHTIIIFFMSNAINKWCKVHWKLGLNPDRIGLVDDETLIYPQLSNLDITYLSPPTSQLLCRLVSKCQTHVTRLINQLLIWVHTQLYSC